MSFYITEAKLRKMIIQELWGMGLASSKPSITQFPKSLERDDIPDNPVPPIEIDSLEELPSAADPTVPEDAQVTINVILGETEEWKHQKDFEKHVKQFQKWWRNIPNTTRYSVEMWLRKQLVKRLNSEEIQDLVANHNAAAKGQSRAKDPNKKPS